MDLHALLLQLRAAAAAPNVRTVQVQIVLPLLRALGWADTDPHQVKLEHPVGAAGAAAADILLTAPRGERTAVWSNQEDRPAVLISIEPHDADLDRQAAALLPHAAHENADLCVLTTGLRWSLYLPRRLHDGGQARFAVLNLQADPPERLEQQFSAYLSRDSVIQQAALRAAEHALSARLDAERLEAEVPRIWRRLLAEPDPLLVELVQEEVRRSIGLHAGSEQVAAIVRASLPPQPAPPAPATAPTPTPTNREPQEPERRQATPRPAGFRLWGAEHRFTSWKELWLTVVRSVYERHSADFERAQALRGASRQYIARSTVNLSSSVQIEGSPWFVETAFNAKECLRHAHGLLELFGYTRSSLEILDEYSKQDSAAPAARSVAEPAAAQQRSVKRPASQAASAPRSFRLWGVEHEFTSWRAMWIEVAAAVHGRHVEDFERALQLRGTVRPYVARSGAEMAEPARVPGTQYFVETKLNQQGTRQRVEDLLALFGYPNTDLELIEE